MILTPSRWEDDVEAAAKLAVAIAQQNAQRLLPVASTRDRPEQATSTTNANRQANNNYASDQRTHNLQKTREPEATDPTSRPRHRVSEPHAPLGLERGGAIAELGRVTDVAVVVRHHPARRHRFPGSRARSRRSRSSSAKTRSPGRRCDQRGGGRQRRLPRAASYVPSTPEPF